jgi:hypothetical protein
MGRDNVTLACLEHWFGVSDYGVPDVNLMVNLIRLHDRLSNCLHRQAIVCAPFPGPSGEAATAVWPFGTAIILFSDYWNAGAGARVNLLLHELTHACIGTLDLGYIGRPGTLGNPNAPPAYWLPAFGEDFQFAIRYPTAWRNADTYVGFMRCLQNGGRVT